MTAGIDAPGTACAFNAHACTTQLLGHGGFDEHHEFPISLGGAANQSTMLVLCPNHHRRQHALIRHLIEVPGGAFDVLKHFATAEVHAAVTAVANWTAAGSPPIAQWPTPAAR